MSTTRCLRYAATLGALLIVVSACGSSSDGSTASTTTAKTSASKLVGPRWVLSDHSALGVPLTGVSVTAAFGAGQVTGTSGCNSYRASYRSSGSTLRIGPDIASTQIACGPGPTAVERVYLDRLPKVDSYAITGRTLTLSGSGKTLLVYEASNGAEAIIAKWTVTGFYTGSAIQSAATGSTLTADFDGEQVTGNGGCNTFGGAYELGASTIKIGPLHSTRKACTDAAVMTQEQQYLAALELATTYEVTGTRLELFRADGGIAVTFEKSTTSG